jgi:hypothetical protein
MSHEEQPTSEHQIGVTNAQESNPDAVIAQLTRQMNALFADGRYSEAARLALEITAKSKDELRDVFARHGVAVLHLDHEAFGIYEGLIEPAYDVHADGTTGDVLDAAAEFGRRHAQEMVLVARKMHEGESDPAQRLGLTIALNAEIGVDEAVEIADVVKDHGFRGATFAPKRRGAVVIYHTDNLGMTGEELKLPPPSCSKNSAKTTQC